MKRKLRRSIYCIVCVLTILSVSCIAAFADVPMYSAGAVDQYTDFVTGPSILVSHDVGVSWAYDINQSFNVNYSLQAFLPATNTADMDGYTDHSSTYFFSDEGADANFESIVDYVNFIYNDLNVDDYGYVSGSVHTDWYLAASISEQTEWYGLIDFTVRDFYCWPGEFDSDTGYYGTSEVEFDFDMLFDGRMIFRNSVVYYSVNGSDEILVHHFGSDDAPSAYENLNFGLYPSLLPGAGSNDVVYIYEWNFYLWDIEASSSDFSGPEYFGELTYNYNPNARNIDINAGRNFDSDNPAVPLLDYTAWIGTAVSGFLDLQIFPHFTLGGVLMTLLAFTCVIWFLKLVAGG